MKYFTKYLPIEGEIKEGDGIIWTKGSRHGVVINDLESGNFDIGFPDGSFLTVKKEDLKVKKLFLCSRDIQVDDIYFWENGPIKDQPLYSSGEQLMDGSEYKVIGEVSTDAVWVTEGMEFEKTDLLPVAYTYEEWFELFDSNARFESHASINRYNQVPNGWKYYKIKCPTCKTFH